MRRCELIALALLWACGGDKTTEDTGDLTDGDTDADGDSDADADTDTDSDADVVTMNGSINELFLEYAVVEPTPSGPVTVCDESYTLTGSTYTGDCPGCDFAFKVTSTPDTGVTPGCNVSHVFDFDGSEYGIEMLLAFAPTYAGYYQNYDNALLFNYIIDLYGATYPGYYWGVLHADGLDEDDTLTFDGTTLNWLKTDPLSYGYGYSPYTYPSGAACTTLDYSALYGDPSPIVVGDVGAQGEVNCATGLRGDIYNLNLLAGDTVSFSVDTVAEESAFDPYIVVMGPDSCLATYADENVDCSFPPPSGFTCPAGEFVATVDGVYNFVLMAYVFQGNCPSGVNGSYDLQVAVTPTPLTELTLSVDEALLASELREGTFRYDLTVEVLP